MSVSSVVIGIHGLLNKPPVTTLESWWRRAIDEGLRRNADRSSAYAFELVYWADVLHPEPLLVEELDEPYRPAPGDGTLPAYEGGPLESARDFVQKWGGRALDKEKELVGLGANVEALIGIKFNDLAEYYDNEGVQRAIRDRLSGVLRRHQDSSIFLLAHSMGSIIAYDVLRELDGEPGLTVEHLITIGSPLGLPIVGLNIRKEFDENKTPEIVRRWTNIADPGDKVSIDCRLSDEYAANARGVAVDDVIVVNGYVSPAGNANNHKSYGYLRAPEFTQQLTAFLDHA